MNQSTPHFLQQFEKNIRQNQILKSSDRFLVACSGGPDSTALFHLLCSMKEWKFRIVLIHFNHGLRGKLSDQDANFVKRLAKKHDIPYLSAKENVALLKHRKDSLEEAARERRYSFFISQAKTHRIKKILLGHTQDDQAETILMRMLQGTGMKGLCGIRRKLERQDVLIYRPLLDFRKQELLDYLKREKLLFCRDRSNQSKRFLRNKIRLHLLPLLCRHYNPKVVEALSRIPEALAAEQEALESFQEQAWTRVLRVKTAESICLNREAWSRFPDAIRYRLLERALKILDPRSGLNAGLWSQVKLQSVKKKFAWTLPRKIELRADRDSLSLERS